MYKWTKKEKEGVRKEVDFFRKRLNLHTWVFDLDFKNKNKIVGGYYHTAEISADPRYMKGSIDFYPKLMEIKKNDGVAAYKETICHEMVHCITERIAQLAISRFTTNNEILQELEGLTQKIAIIVQNDDVSAITWRRDNKRSKELDESSQQVQSSCTTLLSRSR